MVEIIAVMGYAILGATGVGALYKCIANVC